MNNDPQENSFANGTIQWGDDLAPLGDMADYGEKFVKSVKREAFIKWLKKPSE